MTSTPNAPTETDRRRRDDDPLRLSTENLHILDDKDLTRVAGGRAAKGTSRQPSFR